MNFRKYHSSLIILFLAFIPILLWFNVPTTLSRFANFSILLTSLGQIFGLVGVVLFSINLILSTRLHLFDKCLNGLNNTYVKHSQIGQIAFILLLFHPLLLLSKYTTNTYEAMLFLGLSGNNWARNWGVLALWMMITLIVLSLYLRPKYNVWKLTHKFFGLAFFFTSIHIWLIPSDISRYLPLKVYILGFVTLGLIAFIYKTVLGKFLVKKYKYIVTRAKRINTLVTEIKLQPQNEKLAFIPGQFVFLNFTNNNIGLESHPFSITSTPDETHLNFLVKNLGDYTSKIDRLIPGMIAEIEGPFGNFSFNKIANKSQIWIAGGIGITPFIAMAKDLVLNTDFRADLFYATRNESESVYLKEILYFSTQSQDRLRIIPFYSENHGHISSHAIKELSGTIEDKDILICAPPRMIKTLKQEFIINGVKKENIHSEEFSF